MKRSEAREQIRRAVLADDESECRFGCSCSDQRADAILAALDVAVEPDEPPLPRQLDCLTNVGDSAVLHTLGDGHTGPRVMVLGYDDFASNQRFAVAVQDAYNDRDRKPEPSTTPPGDPSLPLVLSLPWRPFDDPPTYATSERLVHAESGSCPWLAMRYRDRRGLAFAEALVAAYNARPRWRTDDPLKTGHYIAKTESGVDALSFYHPTDEPQMAGWTDINTGWRPRVLGWQPLPE